MRKRLGAINLLLLVAQLIVCGIAWRGIDAQKSAMTDMTLISKAARYHQDADVISAHIAAEVYSALASKTLSTGKNIGEQESDLNEHFADLLNDFRTLERIPLPADLTDSLKQVERAADAFMANTSATIIALRADPESVSRRLPEFNAASASLSNAMDAQTQVFAARIVAANDLADSAAQAAKQWLVTATILTTLLVASIVAMVGATIRRSLQRVRDVAQDIAGGNLAVRTVDTGPDEIGHLGTSINQMADSLNEVIGRLRADAERDAFNSRLGDALDAADSEAAAYNVVARAVQEISPLLPAELLLSDSSRAHLERAAQNPALDAPSCAVHSPYECLAIRRGTTQRFANSADLNACTHLQGRPCGRVTGVCVPLSFMGRSLGVLHTAAPVGEGPTDGQVAQLGYLGAQAGVRIGTVRAFARTQLQAATDSLTGLNNRRAATEALNALRSARKAYAFVLCDLDHFKSLNDRHGHDTGDAALRLFGDVLRRLAREEDVVARWGGEEFIVILKDATVHTATEVVERIRSVLGAAISAASSPAFTASFGISDSTMAANIQDVVGLADAALYAAKDAGRDRWVIADPAQRNDRPGRHRAEHPVAINNQMIDSGIHETLPTWPRKHQFVKSSDEPANDSTVASGGI